MKFGILGPLQVIGDDLALIPIRQARQRGLLAVLLLHHGQPVPTQRLAEMLWGSDQPRGVPEALRTHVWAVRRQLAPSLLLLTTAAGYRLDVQPGELDLDEFRQLSQRAEDAVRARQLASAAGLLGRALRLWREPPLGDIPATPAMAWAVRQLTQERQASRETLIEARFALGQRHQLIPGLSAEVAAHPERERLIQLLMLSLYGCDRRAEALDVYRRSQATLARRYGISPGPGLQRLHQQMLADDPALSLATG